MSNPGFLKQKKVGELVSGSLRPDGRHKVGVEQVEYLFWRKVGVGHPGKLGVLALKGLAAIDADFPLGIKPAVKEDFFYGGTKAKAWRANNREE